MAEFLVQTADNWMDALSKAEIDEYKKKYTYFQQKYDMRSQPGDIVEIREDGFWDKRGHDKSFYCVIKIPGLSLSAAKEYSGPAKDQLKTDITKKFRFNVDLTNISLDEKKHYVETGGIQNLIITDKQE